MKAMILAAGKGKRMLPLTLNTPKPLLQINGKSLIQHQIEKLANAGVVDIVINHSYHGEQIVQALGSGEGLGVNIQYSHEEKPLETAGGIIQALPLLGDEPFIIINADIWIDYPFAELPVLSADACQAHLVMVENASHHLNGDFAINKQGLLQGLLMEANDAVSRSFTYSGLAVFCPEFFAGLAAGKRKLRPLFEAAIANQTISGELFQGDWVDVGTPERFYALQQQVLL